MEHIKYPKTTRRILALAIMSSFCLPLTGNADEGNVTLAGTVSTAFEQIDAGGAEGSVSEVNTNESFLTIKGEEPLGNGLKAIFHFDAFLDLDRGGGNTGFSGLFGPGRDGYIGLAGDFGTVAIGFIAAPYRIAPFALDPFGTTIGDRNALMGTIPSFDIDGEFNGAFFDSGCGDALIYFAPNFKGLSGLAEYCNDEVGASRTDKYGLMVNYTNGPLFLAYSHDAIQLDSFDDLTADQIAASYTFAEVFTLSGSVERISADSFASLERNAYWLAGTYVFGNNALKAAFSHAEETDDGDNGGDNGAYNFSLGVDHNFSKRTKIFAVYTRTENDDNGFYGVGTAPAPLISSTGSTFAAEPGADVDAFGVGIRTNF